MSVVDRLKSEILPKVVKEGWFGADKIEFIDFLQDEKNGRQGQFSAKVLYGDVVMATKNDKKCVQSVFIKVQGFFDPSFQWKFNTKFHNEILFYTEIIPFLRQFDSENILDALFPKLIYGVATFGKMPTEDILILENVQKHGFKSAPSKTFIDYEHIKLSLQSLAKFHSLCFASKKSDPEGLYKLVLKIRDTQWVREKFWKLELKYFIFFRENCKRGILPLKDDPKYKDKLSDISAVVENIGLSMLKLVTPVEPISVICHGDFCRNNIFYRYDADGKPVDIKFFDLTTVRYSSPVIDLSFFLFMNSSPELRSSKWDEMLETYHTGLKSNPILEDTDLPSLEDLNQDFRRRGFYGYVHCSFFLPMMLEENPKWISHWDKHGMEEHIEFRLRTGGEKGTFYVTEIVKYMIDRNFDFKFILNFELNGQDQKDKRATEKKAPVSLNYYGRVLNSE